MMRLSVPCDRDRLPNSNLIKIRAKRVHFSSHYLMYEQLRQDSDDCCGEMCKLTRKQRLYGFCYCLAGGFALSLIVSFPIFKTQC